MKIFQEFKLGVIALSGVALMMAACSTSDITIPAPVVDHSIGKAPNKDETHARASSSAPSVQAPPAKVPNKPGYYTVKPGDTIYHIALDNGQNWKDLARWNNIENANLIEPGQVLRVLPPEATVSANGVVVRPVNAQNNPSSSTGSMTPVAVIPPPPSAANAVPGQAPVVSPPSTSTTSAAAPSETVKSSDTPNFQWPATGKVVGNFDEVKNKGIDISGKEGDPVLAAADGKVVYAGSGLRGYGNLLIIKHNNTYLSAYAHNQSLLVKEDQVVKQGQKIAEVGSSDAEQVGLHFEIRKLGKPVDPIKWLPSH